MLCLLWEQSKKSKTKVDHLICTLSLCKKRYYLWKGTIFYRSRITHIQRLQILEYGMQKVSIKNICYFTGLSRRCVYRCFKKVAKVLIPRYYANPEKVGGKGIKVEVDEYKFGKRKYNKGHRVEGVWVLGIKECSGERRVKLIFVNDRTKATLTKILVRYVEKDTKVHTDCWKGYNSLSEYFDAHLTVNHSDNFKDPVTKSHTNSIEGN
ncbi:hypothetical protein NGRA_2350 [Nosema granulosis]|uniref:ISXO2-like transposase domain-containing protein n=1 Tax=Nosema granulosis TaxID=83296 RepID=A0A9P6KYI4_9MICR|nr:hypothetical protein NGRA_2350 [Nosema granulosis]